MKKLHDIEPKSIEISCSLLYALFFEGDFHVKLPTGSAEVSLKRVRQEHFDPAWESKVEILMLDGTGMVS